MAEREMLTAEEVATLLGFSIETVRSLAQAGKLPGTKMGREWRFSKKRIMAIVEGNDPLTSGSEGKAAWERP